MNRIERKKRGWPFLLGTLAPAITILATVIWFLLAQYYVPTPSGAITPEFLQRVRVAIRIQQLIMVIWVFGFMLCPIIAALISYKQKRASLQIGKCHVCGYDLRATPTRCPECGAIGSAPPHTI